MTLGAAGEGMVAGDAVNTTAHVQAAAEPGQVLRGRDHPFAHSRPVSPMPDVGEHLLKGKAEPVGAVHVASGFVVR